MLRVFCLTVAVVAFVVGGASAQPAAPTFEKDILPIFKARCFECHGVALPKGGLDLQTRASLVKGGRTGAALAPGSLKNSLLWVNLSTDKMPANEKKLSDAEKETIRAWILAGAPGQGVAASKTILTQGGGKKAPPMKRGVDAVAKIIDTAILDPLKKDKASLAPITDDAEFLRRVYLDLNGRIPTIEQARTFLDGKAMDKRSKLVEELLATPLFAKQYGSLWARLITAEEPYLRNDLENWLTDQLQKNRGWDQIVRDMITAVGKGPETAFIMSNVENKVPQPDKLAGSTAKLFLGMQLQCAECHNHPFTSWKQTDFWALAAFYGRTKVLPKGQPVGVGEVAQTDVKAKGKGPAVAIKGPAIVIPTSAGRGAGKVVKAKFLQGGEPDLKDMEPLRPALAAWITSADNPYFAQAAVNRVWAQLFGYGQVNPVDDLQEDNPASHPVVLQTLAEEFQASGYDLKHLVRCICATSTYQRSSRRPAGADENDLPYARMKLKVMSPEALYDSLILATGMKEIAIQTTAAATSGTGGAKKGAKETARDRFLRFFNTRDIDTLPVDFTHGIPQALSLMNDPVFNRGTPRIEGLAKLPQDQAIETLFLATVSRRPRAEELTHMKDFLTRQTDPVRGYVQIQWVLLNSAEFMLIR
jgi:mono/diheme cytochrome c family protein